MSDRFEIGEKAWYEVRPNTVAVPRWECFDPCDTPADGGGSGYWNQAEITDISATYYVAKMPEPLYSEWNFRPGWLYKEIPAGGKPVKKRSNMCECDILELWAFGHAQECPEKKEKK